MPDKFFPIVFRSDEGGSGDGGAGGGTGGDGGSGGSGGSQEDGGDGGSGSGGGSQPTVESLQSELKKTRDEAAKNRRERNELQKRIEALEAKEKTETERLTDSQTQLTKERDEALARTRKLTIRALAPQAGIAQSATADAADLFKPSETLDWDDEEAVVKELKDFVKARPHLAAKQGGADGGEGGSRESEGDMNSLIRAAAGRG